MVDGTVSLKQYPTLPDVRWWQTWPGLGCRKCGCYFWHSRLCDYAADWRKEMEEVKQNNLTRLNEK